MRSLLQNIQQAVGNTASRIAVPSVREVSLQQMPEPTNGWLAEDDYLFRPPKTHTVDLPGITSPSQLSLELLGVPHTGDVALGKPARTVETPEAEWCFDGNVEHVPLALLTESETEELRAKLRSSATPNRVRRLGKTPSTS